ncbi:4-(cytidine 5'-diphospho)-2-C-methyl-D-erythritol kinase [Bacteroidota bacterium]
MPIFESNAKINLGLEVLFKREDGFHEINTIFTKICLSDEISVEPAKELTVQCIPSLKIPQEKNLAFMAGKIIQKYYDCKSKAAKIDIKKKIPDGGGLGGGSSNAATVLIALNKLWEINAPINDLQKIALELGSDVPFFMKDRAAIGQGKGEILEYFDLKLPYHILLICPGIKIPTAWAYEQLKKSSETKKGTDLKTLCLNHITNPEFLKKNLKNDFEETVFGEYPELKNIKKKLYQNCADFALMSGSGSTMYGLFSNMKNLKKAESAFNNYKTHICTKIP